MIARIWHGRVPAEKADAYVDYLERTGLADYRSTKGNRGVYMLRALSGGDAHLLLISLWDSWDPIRRFAGPNIEKAVYYPEDDAFLVEKEPGVTHYEVLAAPGVRGSRKG